MAKPLQQYLNSKRVLETNSGLKDSDKIRAGSPAVPYPEAFKWRPRFPSSAFLAAIGPSPIFGNRFECQSFVAGSAGVAGVGRRPVLKDYRSTAN
jgi:hypothetical protein